MIDIAVIRVPRISNFTDFNPLESIQGVSLRYVKQSIRAWKSGYDHSAGNQKYNGRSSSGCEKVVMEALILKEAAKRNS